ncbi:DEAD/DEAH box helicase family protein [Teredinibacter turnerae]|uniref:DEAD/DEAH box helicase n=1 Tax=Teredinibacter turnerae TaxID=2426 RepID=UPI0003725C11|nr:DEAD/DEAH box helicase family protein [Teredinibacter turnerae]
MKLRRWQREAVSRCLSRFNSGQAHFLCLATPGAGKTYMASTVAKRLLDSGKIDYVFCFSPSLNVSVSFQATLESVLRHRLDGLLGAKGKVLTYQSMLNLDEAFWSLFEDHRILVIFDEIHHCAGDQLRNANAWGQKIIQHIQGKATYTLALTGTPWRSDRIPIALTSYCHEGKVHCDYTYGLAQAIRDGVCRTPRVTGVDNEKITVQNGEKEDVYRSIEDLLRFSRCTYQQLLENTTLIRYLMEQSHQALSAIRKTSPNAGGLIVAASVEHALLIATMLESISGESPSIVTYMHENSQHAIQRFRESNTKWIVSVGMISEGTDIPRLQVCCHLTRVKTELYFRQVLGRILRVQKDGQEDATLIMPAEPKLMAFANRVAEDIPAANTVSRKVMKEGLLPPLTDMPEVQGTLDPTASSIDEIADENEGDKQESRLELASSGSGNEDDSSLPFNPLAEAYETSLGIFGRFRKRMIDISPVLG